MHCQMQAQPLMQNVLLTAPHMHASLHMVQVLTQKLQVSQTLQMVQQPPKAAENTLTPACLPWTGPKNASSMGLERLSMTKWRQRARVASTHVVQC
jgi:hypothetical protein